MKPANPSAAQDPSAGAGSFLSSSLARLETLLDEERGDLSQGRFARLAEFNSQKSQLLLELNRAMRAHLPAVAAEAALEERLASLRHKLIDNRAVIGVHLDAAREVVALIVEAIREAEADGTYSRSGRPALRGRT